MLRCLGLALAVGAAVGEDATCSAGGGPGCGASSPRPFCPHKGHDLNHSGWSKFTGPFDLSKPLWTWEEPNRKAKGNTQNRAMKVFHGSPILDGEYNTYIPSTTGWVYSISKAGETRWEFETAGANPGNLAFLDGVVYTIDDRGTAFAIDARTGKELWRKKVAKGAPSDSHALTAHDGLVLTGCNPVAYDLGWGRPPDLMNEAVCALDAKDGQVRWIFDQMNFTGRKDALACNQMQAIVGDTAVFGDGFGGVYRVALADGTIRWHAKHATGLETIANTQGMVPYGTTATLVVGENDRVYHGFNIVAGMGTVRAHNIDTGILAWQRYFPGTEANAAVAVGKLYGWGDLLAVVVPLGNNPAMTTTSLLHGLQRLVGWTKLESPVVALSSKTGETLWTFNVAYDGTCAGSYYDADSGEGPLCAPDTWGTPTIGADGTVYVNWSGGKAFTLRDANGDGVVDPKDPQEVSSYYHGFGANGATALGPGFAVAPSCRQVMAWSS